MADWPDLHALLSLPPWLHLQLATTAAPIANPIGGLSSSAAWMQQSELNAYVGTGLARNPERWREIDHWQARVRFDLYNGQPGFGARTGSIIEPQTIDLPAGLWFSGASLSRRNRDDTLRISAGLLSLDQEFVVAPAYNAYLFASINNTLNLNILGLPLSPFTTPGLTLSWHSGPLGAWRMGAYWLDPVIQLASLFGVETNLPRVKGNLQILEWGYDLPGANQHYSRPIALSGGASAQRMLPLPRLQLGTFRSLVNAGSSNVSAGLLPTAGTTALNRVGYGSLTLPARLPLGRDNRLWLAAQLGFDPASNPTPVFLSGGWLCQGPVRDRPLDVLAIGVARTGFSAPLLPDLSWQAVVEVNYTFLLNANLSLQPLVQWVLNPSGNGQVAGIVNTSLQLKLSF